MFFGRFFSSSLFSAAAYVAVGIILSAILAFEQTIMMVKMRAIISDNLVPLKFI